MKWLLPVLAFVLLSPLLQAQTAERQLAFADSLYDSGDDVFALLEFKRFLFQYPDHAETPRALQRLARLQISATGNFAAAQESAQTLLKKYPNSPLAAETKAFVDFVEVNSDFGGQPLQLWLKAENLEKQQRFDHTIVVLQRIVTDFPQAHLADDALYQIASIQYEKLGKTDAARETFAQLAKAYPESPLLVKAEFQAASALGTVEGKEAEAAEALRRFATKHPDDALAKTALEQAATLERRGFVLKRQFEATAIRTYTVRRAGQAGAVYQCDIELATGLSQREVQATLEDALVKEGVKRANTKDQVTVQGYFNYPITKAGKATWTPGADPKYEIEQRQTKHLLMDLGLDILKQP